MQIEGKIYDKSMRNDMHPYSVYIPSNESWGGGGFPLSQINYTSTSQLHIFML